MQNKNIKIVHIVEGFTGGLATYITLVLPELVKHDIDVTLICSLNRHDPDADISISKLREQNIKVYTIPMVRNINPLKDIYSFGILLRLFSKNKYDIVHTHCSKAGALGRIAAWLTGQKTRIHTPHCFAFLRCGNFLKKHVYLSVERLLGKITTKLITVSRSQASAAISSKIAPEGNCMIVDNGLPQEFPEKETTEAKGFLKNTLWEIETNTRIVTTGCRLVNYKGISRFIQTAKYSQHPNTIFLIAGDGELKTTLEKYICESNLTHKVKLLGFVSDMKQLYAISDVIVLCSDAEGQPYLLLEAMRAKRPIVATSVLGNDQLILHGKTGCLTSNAPKDIAQVVDNLLSDNKKCKEYADNAYEYFHKNHLLEYQVSKLINIYKNSILKNQDKKCLNT